MASIDLTALHINGDDIQPLDFGGLMPSAIGGATDRFDRLGNRFAVQVTTPRMPIEPEGRRWSARLLKARRLGGIVAIEQFGLVVGAPGAPKIAGATAAGRMLPLAGLTPGYAIREGQWLNYFDAAGQRYLDQADAQVIAGTDGTASVPIQNLIRVPLAANAPIDLVRPCLEGWIEGDFSLARALDHTIAFSFTLTEKA